MRARSLLLLPSVSPSLSAVCLFLQRRPTVSDGFPERSQDHLAVPCQVDSLGRSVHIQMMVESIRQPSRDRIGHAKFPSQLKLRPLLPLESSSILCLLSSSISWRTNEAPSYSDARISSLYVAFTRQQITLTVYASRGHASVSSKRNTFPATRPQIQ